MPYRILALILLLTVTPGFARAQTPTKPGSDNMQVQGHLPLGGPESVADIELEQELDRPYAYVAKARYRENYPRGMDIIDLSDPAKPKLLKRCRRRWSRFARWARAQGVEFGKPRIWRTRTEVA